MTSSSPSDDQQRLRDRRSDVGQVDLRRERVRDVLTSGSSGEDGLQKRRKLLPVQTGGAADGHASRQPRLAGETNGAVEAAQAEPHEPDRAGTQSGRQGSVERLGDDDLVIRILLTFPWVFHRGSGGQSPASLSIASAISAAGE